MAKIANSSQKISILFRSLDRDERQADYSPVIEHSRKIGLFGKNKAMSRAVRKLLGGL